MGIRVEVWLGMGSFIVEMVRGDGDGNADAVADAVMLACILIGDGVTLMDMGMEIGSGWG
jgi:hypothetical protein